MLDAALAVGADVGDTDHVGCARRAKRYTCGNDDTVARITETFRYNDTAGAVDHVVQIVCVASDHAVQTPYNRQTACCLDDRRKSDDRNLWTFTGRTQTGGA